MESLILSYGLDTNGQNARYVKASRKYGTDNRVLQALAIGDYDPAAVMARFSLASRKFKELRIRSVHRSEHIYQSMPSDIVWTRQNEPAIKRLAHEADIIHLNNSWRPWQKLRFSRRKPMLLHHHGSMFRVQTKELLRWAYQNRAIQATSTVDLLRYAPESLHWLPTAYDVDWLRDFGNRHRREPDGRILVAHAPTDGDLHPWKGTFELQAAIARLQAEGLPVDLLVIEGLPWIECMALKATADIYFDQVKLGYGCNAIEAWGMGIPVIAGADEWTLGKMREVYGSKDLPFYEATADTIAEAITDLATHKARRTAYAKRGMAHIRKFHDERPALTRLAELYRMAIEHQDDEFRVTAIPPVTFTADVPQLRVANRLVDFPYTTDNPNMARQIRMYALRRPRFGIQEVA